MIIIALAQIQMGFNVSALPVSIGGIVEDFNTSPSSVGTALVVYSLAVAGFVMLGAKLGKLIGARLAFQVGVILYGLAMAAMALSTSTTMMIQVQGIAGLAAAVLVPSLVVLIAHHYRGQQQSQSLGLLGAAAAIAGVLAFLVIGVLGSLLNWRSWLLWQPPGRLGDHPRHHALRRICDTARPGPSFPTCNGRWPGLSVRPDSVHHTSILRLCFFSYHGYPGAI